MANIELSINIKKKVWPILVIGVLCQKTTLSDDQYWFGYHQTKIRVGLMVKFVEIGSLKILRDDIMQ